MAVAYKLISITRKQVHNLVSGLFSPGTIRELKA
jgi:hypothetical protein